MGTYWAHEHGGVTPYPSVSGSLTVSLDQNDKVTGTFNFRGEHGSPHITASKGKIEVTGFVALPVEVRLPTDTATGSMKGEVVGGPLPSPEFEAEVVSLREVDNGVSKKYFEIIGRQYDELGMQNFVAILLDVDQTALDYELGSNREARARFAKLPRFGFAYAIGGSLNFTSLPASGRAVGSLDCRVQKNQEPPFQVKVKFDIAP